MVDPRPTRSPSHSRTRTTPIGQTIAAAGGNASDQVIDCLAKAFHDSDISDDALRAITKGDTGYKGSKKDADALQETVTTELPKCITG